MTASFLHNMVTKKWKDNHIFTDLMLPDDEENDKDGGSVFFLFGFTAGGHNELLQESLSSHTSTMEKMWKMKTKMFCFN